MQEITDKPAEGIRAYKAIFLWALLFAVVTMVASLVVIFVAHTHSWRRGRLDNWRLDARTRLWAALYYTPVKRAEPVCSSRYGYLYDAPHGCFHGDIYRHLAPDKPRSRQVCVLFGKRLYGALTVLATIGGVIAIKTLLS
jgi:hypothetical protein